MDGHRYIELRLERGSPVHPRWQAYATIAATAIQSENAAADRGRVG